MRLRHAVAAVTLIVLPPMPARAQVLSPGDEVRVTVSRPEGDARLRGRLLSFARDTINLRTVDAPSVAIPRSLMRRLERRRSDVPVEKWGLTGCISGGLALGLLGFATRDPDSPGLENRLGGIGLLVGCIAGGSIGLVTGIVSSAGWQEVRFGEPPR